MTTRILARAATSGRTDDNVEALRKRFATHREQCKVAHMTNGYVLQLLTRLFVCLRRACYRALVRARDHGVSQWYN